MCWFVAVEIIIFMNMFPYRDYYNYNIIGGDEEAFMVDLFMENIIYIIALDKIWSKVKN